MKIFSKFIKISLISTCLVLPFQALNASDLKEETEKTRPSTMANLKSIKRAILWSQKPDFSATEEEGLKAELGLINGEPFKVSAPFRIAFADLIYAVVASDGELSPAEEKSLVGRLTNKGNFMDPEDFKKVKDYYIEEAAKAKSGKYKGVDISPIVKKCEDEMKNLGYKDDYKTQFSRAALFTAILAARADGFAKEEEATAKQVAKKLGVSDEVFQAIDSYCKLLTSLKEDSTRADDGGFKQEVQKLAGSVEKLFQ